MSIIHFITPNQPVSSVAAILNIPRTRFYEKTSSCWCLTSVNHREQTGVSTTKTAHENTTECSEHPSMDIRSRKKILNLDGYVNMQQHHWRALYYSYHDSKPMSSNVHLPTFFYCNCIALLSKGVIFTTRFTLSCKIKTNIRVRLILPLKHPDH